MIIGIDNISPGAATGPQTIGGMRAYLEDLLSFLPSAGPRHTFKVFTPLGALPGSQPFAPNLQVSACPHLPRSRLGRVIFEQVVLPRRIAQEHVDVWLGICNILPLALPCPSVLIVQSLQYLSFPGSYSLAQQLYLRLFGPASARRAGHVIALSRAARDMIVQRLGVPPAKVTVAYNGISQAMLKEVSAPESAEATAPIYRLTGERPYVLSVSSYYEYKNLRRLIEAFGRISAHVPHLLLLAGAETARVRAEALRAQVRQRGLEDRVIFAGRVPHDQLAPFYRHADVLVMPSLEETFGLPIVEAMALGCPVVTSERGSMAEVAGDAACLVDPEDVGSIARGLQHVLTDRSYLEDLRSRGLRQAAQFNNNRSVGTIATTLEGVAQ